MLKSGDLVEIELEIDSKNDYEYIIFEDMKAVEADFIPLPVFANRVSQVPWWGRHSCLPDGRYARTGRDACPTGKTIAPDWPRP